MTIIRHLISFVTIIACGFAVNAYLEGITYFDLISVILQTPAYNACLISMLYLYVITPNVGLRSFDAQIAMRHHKRCAWLTVRMTEIFKNTLWFMGSFLAALIIPAIVNRGLNFHTQLSEWPWMLCGLALTRLCLLGFTYQLLSIPTNNRIWNVGIIIAYLFMVENNQYGMGFLSSIIPQYILCKEMTYLSLPQAMIIPLQALCALAACYALYDKRNIL